MNHTMEIKSEGFEGIVELRLASYPERLKYMQVMGFKADAEGKMVTASDPIESLLKSLEITPKHILKVEVKRVSDEKIYGSWEQLTEDADAVCNEIAAVVIGGLKLGK